MKRENPLLRIVLESSKVPRGGIHVAALLNHAVECGQEALRVRIVHARSHHSSTPVYADTPGVMRAAFIS